MSTPAVSTDMFAGMFDGMFNGTVDGMFDTIANEWRKVKRWH